MIVKTTLAFLSIAAFTSAIAQEHCTSRTITDRWLQAHGQHIDLAHEAAQLEQEGLRGSGGVQTIPVVVHVVWNTNSENVSDALILSTIAQMNKDYQALNSDYNSVRTQFAASRANAQIDFCLATTDPSGNPTTGIVRFQTTETWFNPDTETDDMKFAPKGTAAWNTTQYLNIWICDISSGATGGLVTAGYAYLPYGGMVGSPIDGLVLDYTYGVGIGDRTATHEVGHYLGLDHPWGNGNCSPNDGISDTPATDQPTFSCSNQNLMRCNTLTQYENFMDYSNCTMMFTNGQAAVMSGVINGSRANLLNSNGCSGAPAVACIPSSGSGPSDGDFIDGVVLGTINNTGSGSDSGPGYVDNTAMSTSLNPGSPYTITITSGNFSDDHYAAWIDYNGDHIFSSSEKLGEFINDAAGEAHSFPFTVPLNAVIGNTVMRVRGVYHLSDEPSPTDPCFSYEYGETEDYGIEITSITTSITGSSSNTLTVRNIQDQVMVSWPRVALEQHVLVMDASGRVIRSFTPTGNQISIKTSDLATGIYQLTISLSGDREVARFFVGGK